MKFLIALVLSIVGVLLALAGAALGTRPLSEWYQNLAKPTWQPEPGTIGLAWSIIYPLMVIASTLVLIKTEAPRLWWTAFGINLLLNAVWSWIFFVWQQPATGSVFLALLWISVLSLVVIAAQTWWLPTLLLVPYLFWVSVACAVNFTIARLNAS